MKKIAVLFLVSVIALSGCRTIPTVITSSDGQAPTPVVSEEQNPSPTQPALPTDTAAPLPTLPPAETPTASAPTGTLAYVAMDGNVKLRDIATAADTAVTTDATTTADPQISYYTPVWSSDGQFLAFQRLSAKSVDYGQDYTFSLWVYDMTKSSLTEVVSNLMTTGFAFRPGTHTLTYALSTAPDYFTGRGQVDATKATGIFGVDVTAGGAPVEIVPAGNGLTIVQPQWSANGNIVAFDEVLQMEGRGNFAYYNMETKQYSHIDKQVGNYDLFMDGSRMVYDTLTYLAGGTERIWLSKLDGKDEVQLSPDYTLGFADGPKLSPDNQQVAYWKGTNGPGEPAMEYELFVQPLTAASEPKSYGMVTSPVSLAWLADGKTLILNVGEYDHREIVTIHVGELTYVKIADGQYPTMRP